MIPMLLSQEAPTSSSGILNETPVKVPNCHKASSVR
jgi:hypothetical protein